MELSFMTQAGVDDMKTHVEEHAALYRCADNAAMLAYLQGKGYLEKMEMAELSAVELLTEGDFAATDIQNVRRLYGAWRTLAPYTAADERFWAGLSHTLFGQRRRASKRLLLRAGKAPLAFCEPARAFVVGRVYGL